MIKVDILEKNCDEEYECFLEGCRNSSVQHSVNWRRVIGYMGTDIPYFAVAKEKNKIVGALPLYYYKCPLGNLLTTTSWYTISGIVSSENGSRIEIYRALLGYAINLGKELDCAAVSIGTNPFEEDKNLYLENFKPDYTLENFVQYMVLSDLFNDKGRIVHPIILAETNLPKI